MLTAFRWAPSLGMFAGVSVVRISSQSHFDILEEVESEDDREMQSIALREENLKATVLFWE